MKRDYTEEEKRFLDNLLGRSYATSFATLVYAIMGRFGCNAQEAGAIMADWAKRQ